MFYLAYQIFKANQLMKKNSNYSDIINANQEVNQKGIAAQSQSFSHPKQVFLRRRYA